MADLKIALVNKHFQLGGIETVVQQIRNGLQRRDIPCDLWFSEFGRIPFTSSMHPMYPPLLNRLQHSRFARAAELLVPRKRWTQRVFKQILHGDHDVVHVHSFDGTYAALECLLELARRKPVVMTLHGAWPFTGGCGQPGDCTRYERECGACPQAGIWPVPAEDDTHEQLAGKCDLLADAPIHFVSPAKHLAEMAHRSVVGKNWDIEIIPNGVDTAFFQNRRKERAGLRQKYGLDPKAVVVLAMSRDFRDPVKGGAIMLEALRQVPEPGMQVLLAGAYSDWFAEQLPWAVRPVSLGFVESREHCAELYGIADIFLFASIAETFPCVILEAMSSECCVVSTPMPAVFEQLGHEVSGLVASSPRAEDLAGELRKACADESLRLRLGAEARRRIIARFGEEKMIDSHVRLYTRFAK